MSAKLARNENINKQRNIGDSSLDEISNWLIPKRNKLREWYRTRFLKCLLNGPTNGLSTTQLEALIPCHRDTVWNIGKQLIGEGIVAKKNSKYENYQLSSEAIYGDPTPMASLFRTELMKKVMQDTAGRWSKHVHAESSKVKDDKHKFEEQKFLIEFALKIGISDICALLEAVRPLPYNNKKSMTDIKKRHKKTSILPGAKKRWTELWVNNVMIKPFDKLQEFIKLPIIERGLAKPKYLEEYFTRNLNPVLPESVKEALLAEHRFLDPDDPSFSPYEMDKASFKKLTGILSNTWPGVNEILESLKKDMSKNADVLKISESRTTESVLLRILQILLNANANKDRKKRFPERENVQSLLEKIHSLLMTLEKTEPENLDRALQILKESEIGLKLPFTWTRLRTLREKNKYRE